MFADEVRLLYNSFLALLLFAWLMANDILIALLWCSPNWWFWLWIESCLMVLLSISYKYRQTLTQHEYIGSL